MRVLAGDIGGTHARLALVDSGGPRRVLLERRSHDSREYPALEPIVQEFLESTGARPEAACLGVACPIVKGICEMSNLTWEIDLEVFGDHVGLPDLRFINDFDAVGWAIGELEGPEDLVTLREGDPEKHGPIGIIGAGTGQGSGFLTWDGARYQVHSSEGGHVDFAPRNSTEVELYAHLATRFSASRTSASSRGPASRTSTGSSSKAAGRPRARRCARPSTQRMAMGPGLYPQMLSPATRPVCRRWTCSAPSSALRRATWRSR